MPPYNEKKVVVATIDYAPLWATMKQKGMSQYRLLQSGIDNKTLDSLKKSKNITLLTLEKLCRVLDCTPNDIVAFQDDDLCNILSCSVEEVLRHIPDET